MMGIGFLATLFVELIAHQLTHKTPSDDKKNETVQNSQTEPFLQAQGDYLVDSSVNQRDGVDPHNQGLIATPENSFYSHFSGDHGHSHGNHHGHSHAHDSSHDDHGHSHLPMDTANQSIIVVLALFLALSFHSIVEGISLGSSDGDTVKSIMIAILAHKGLESFSLGTSLINSNASTLKYITFCLIFSLMTPIGVIIGALVLSNTEGIVSAFITGFAAGTFTYVSIVEVLLPEFKKQQDLLFKAIAASVGFAGMAIIALWV
jgi:zinc transporter ZupT